MSTTTNPTSGAKVPAGDTLTSMIGLGPIPFTKVIATRAMVEEANRDTDRHSEALSEQENATRAAALKKAQKKLDKAVTGTIEPLIKKIKALHAEINIIDRMIITYQDRPLVGPAGEHLTATEAKHRQNQLREQVTHDTENGSTKHQQSAPTRRRAKEIGLLLIDFPVFLYAMISLLNVNLPKVAQGNLADIVPMVIAATFAILGTVLLAVIYRAMGRRHRAYKTDDRTIAAGGAGRTVQIEIASLIAVAAAAAAVMASRVALEGIEAEASTPMVASIASLFALLLMFSCYINYRSEFDNGSTTTDQLNILSNQTRQREHHHADLVNARQAKVEQAGVNTATMLREIAKAKATAHRSVTDSAHDKSIRIARSYHGHRAGAPLPEPQLNTDPLVLATRQARELAEHQAYLEAPISNELALFEFLTQE